MWGEYHGLPLDDGEVALLLCVPVREYREGVGVYDEPSLRAGKQPRHEHLRRLRHAKPHADHGDVRPWRHAYSGLLHERGFRHERAGGDSGRIRHDEMDEAGACGPGAEAAYDGRVNVVA